MPRLLTISTTCSTAPNPRCRRSSGMPSSQRISRPHGQRKIGCGPRTRWWVVQLRCTDTDGVGDSASNGSLRSRRDQAQVQHELQVGR